MTFEVYQEQSKKTAVYSKSDGNLNYPLTYPALGLLSEAGEVAGKIKKVIRDNGGIIDEAKKADIAAELGDVLWYVSQISTELGVSLADVAQSNLDKLLSRMDRGVILGSGDNR
jgi:NTP pyrophosphatase (non-canonical NTP hydrolase)